MRVYECVRCGARFPVEHVTEWGKHASSSGYGPRPICTGLRASPTATKAKDGSTPNEVCRGDLIVTEISAKEGEKVAPLVPIAP